jgi:hypothetical protein
MRRSSDDSCLTTWCQSGGLLAYLIAASAAFAADYEWDLSGDLNPSLGRGVLEYADSQSASLASFGTTDGVTVPHIGGQPATFMRVPAFTALANGYNLTLTDSGPNGGGAYLNQYSIIFDVLSPGNLGWTPFFNTDPENSAGNDADFYLAYDGSLGIGDLGYTTAGVIVPDTWYRIAFVADLGAGNVAYYVNGVRVLNRTGGSLLDGRFSLYSNQDPGPDVRLFNEGDTSGDYTHQLDVAAIAFTDRSLSAAEVAALGGPRADGIFLRLHIAYDGQSVEVTWPGSANVKLQRTVGLSPVDWQDVPDTLGASSCIETVTIEAGYFRLVTL